MCDLLVIDSDLISYFVLEKTNEKHRYFENISRLEISDGLKFLIDNKENDQILPDFIFLDIDVPGLDSWAFLESYKLHCVPLLKKIKFFVISASVFKSDKYRAESYDFVIEFISKPILSSKLAAIARN